MADTPTFSPPAGAQKGSPGYEQAEKQAHPKPHVPDLWKSSANPVRPYAEWLKESKEYIQFVNPGDLRVAAETCGSEGCHVKEVRAVRTSMMTTGPMLWEAALYNNGGFPYKDARFGESYSPDGKPQRVNTVPLPSQELDADQGRASPSGSAGPLGGFAARKHPARVSSAAAASGRKSAFRIRTKIPAVPTTS